MDPRIFDKIDKFNSADKRSTLHLAAKEADIPLAYECIRIGTAISHKDAYGITALLLACMTIRSTKVIKEIVRVSGRPPPDSPGGRALSDQFLDDEVSRLLRIATLLVEQHADVNVSADGETPLGVAAEASCWPLVELLLRHGARPLAAGTPGAPLFRSANQRSRYNALVRTTQVSTPRPARRCPCWSGALLADCHAARTQPYPPSFLCRCGRNRTYERCCMRREFTLEERWSAEDDWLQPVDVRHIPLPPGDDAFRAGFDKNQEMMNAAMQVPGFLGAFQERMAGFWQTMFSDLPPDVMDPAFLYALGKVDFAPRLWGGNLSKVEAKKRMDEWNGAIDKYIARGTDSRDRFTIELMSKIGMNGGALHKECDCCFKVENRDFVGKLRCCSSCKIAVYCSSECQVRDWPRHKAECKTKSRKEQELKAQKAMEYVMSEQTRQAANMDVSVEGLTAALQASRMLSG
ncbi:zf-MYND domain-containing protein [Phanerochaete sordida]|uniref:Zf-MYND domain-containing protein n=1 Tax=Phanerochaete sordida TaxID=48140 RepID=A0A9P3LM87_9APHY|nr:zf-MYND domain-containing protein [Phanerochaete sordida]